MTHFRDLTTMGALAATLAMGLCAVVSCDRPPASTAVAARHVVLISFDTTRPDHFGLMGNDRVRTPRMDSLADEAIVFADYMTVAATTLASHTSLFTGNYPHSHGVPRNGFMVHADNEMLAEVLGREGFHTVGVLGSFALESRFHIDQGFDVYDETFTVSVGDMGADQNQRRGDEVTDAVIGYLDDNGTPDRLFLFVHYFDPHAPYAAPAPFDTLYDKRGQSGLPSMREIVQGETFTPQEREAVARRQVLHYASEVSYLDREVGRLIDDLRDRGVLDEALLIITSDHGENLIDHPDFFGHGRTLYQSTVHGVCLVRLPGTTPGRGARVDAPVATIDIAPTIFGALGISGPDAEGVPIDLVNPGRVSAERERFAEASKPWRDDAESNTWINADNSRCVRSGKYKFIQTPYTGNEELYDLSTDPGETRNLMVIAPRDVADVATRLRDVLDRWASNANPLPSAFERKQHEDTVEKLRSLGYIR